MMQTTIAYSICRKLESEIARKEMSIIETPSLRIYFHNLFTGDLKGAEEAYKLLIFPTVREYAKKVKEGCQDFLYELKNIFNRLLQEALENQKKVERFERLYKKGKEIIRKG